MFSVDAKMKDFQEKYFQACTSYIVVSITATKVTIIEL